jgi:hypothetical protein
VIDGCFSFPCSRRRPVSPDRQILDRALDNVGFWQRYGALRRRERLVWLLLYDMHGRKFSWISRNSATANRNEVLRKADLLEVEEALIEMKTRVAAGVSRLRIGGSALSLGTSLPHPFNSYNNRLLLLAVACIRLTCRRGQWSSFINAGTFLQTNRRTAAIPFAHSRGRHLGRGGFDRFRLGEQRQDKDPEPVRRGNAETGIEPVSGLLADQRTRGASVRL